MLPYATLYDDALRKFCAAVRKDGIKEGDEDGEAQLQQFLKNRATAQQVRNSATDPQHKTGKKYGSINIGDKGIIFQKWIDIILSNIGNAIDIGDIFIAPKLSNDFGGKKPFVWAEANTIDEA